MKHAALYIENERLELEDKISSIKSDFLLKNDRCRKIIKFFFKKISFFQVYQIVF